MEQSCSEVYITFARKPKNERFANRDEERRFPSGTKARDDRKMAIRFKGKGREPRGKMTPFLEERGEQVREKVKGSTLRPWGKVHRIQPVDIKRQ